MFRFQTEVVTSVEATDGGVGTVKIRDAQGPTGGGGRGRTLVRW